MNDEDDRRRFEAMLLPHLDAAYNLARWLTRNDQDAEDVVHDALLRALRYIGGLRGERGRPWLLQIVRHTCYAWLRENRPSERVAFDDDDDPTGGIAAPAADEPPAVAMRRADRQRIDAALAALPIPLREVVVLRELEDLSYAEIARVAGIPVGTVMSRLSRGRALLRDAMTRPPGAVLRPVPRSTLARGRP